MIRTNIAYNEPVSLDRLGFGECERVYAIFIDNHLADIFSDIIEAHEEYGKRLANDK